MSSLSPSSNLRRSPLLRRAISYTDPEAVAWRILCLPQGRDLTDPSRAADIKNSRITHEGEAGAAADSCKKELVPRQHREPVSNTKSPGHGKGFSFEDRKG